MKILKYKPNHLLLDAGRGILGLIICLGPLLVVDEILIFIQWILGAGTLVFAAYLLRTGFRARSELHFSQDEMRLVTPLQQKSITISAMTKVKLSHYAGPRARPGEGVTQLSIWGDGNKIVVESSLDAFDTVLEAIAAICRRRREVEVDVDSVHNFKALGLSVAPEWGEGASQDPHEG